MRWTRLRAYGRSLPAGIEGKTLFLVQYAVNDAGNRALPGYHTPVAWQQGSAARVGKHRVSEVQDPSLHEMDEIAELPACPDLFC